VRHLVNGGGLLFVTLTLPHDAGDRLRPLFASVADGWRTVTGCRGVKAFRRENPFEFVRAAEVTYGSHGFHPHLHSILATERPLGRDEVKAIEPVIFEPWRAAMVRAGYREPSERYGVTVIRADARSAEYVTKVAGFAEELTSMGTKTRGRTEPMFSVLRRAVAGDPVAAVVWAEYELGTKGRCALTFSRRFRTMLGMGQELTEAEALDLGRGESQQVGELKGWLSDALVRHPRGFEIFCESVGPGTPEAWEAAVCALRGTLPWSVRAELEYLHYGAGIGPEPVPIVMADSERVPFPELAEVGF
jgi:hypothetical protein